MGFIADWRLIRRFRKLVIKAKDAARLGELSRLEEIVLTEVHQEVKRRDPDLFQSMVNSYLRDAAPEGNQAIVRFLLALGADPNGVDPKQGISALTLAAYRGQDTVALELLQHGGDSNLMTEGGWTPLMFAAAECSPETVSAMLAAGADPNLTTPEGMRAKDLAELRNRTENLKILDSRSKATALEGISRGEDPRQH